MSKCEFVYSNTGKRCISDVDFECTPITSGIEWKLCRLHVGFFLMRREGATHVVERTVPVEDRNG